MAEQPGATIVLVDDDEPKRYSIAKILRRAGYEVQEAGTGGEALRLAGTRPDLIILDVKLPDISGLAVCRRIKSDPATSFIPVLHISSTFVDIEDKVHGLDSGADGYLTNVSEPLELLATVRALLRARRAEDAAQLSTRQWQTTFDAISDGVLLLDHSGKIVQVNRTLEQILGQPWTELVGKELDVVLGQPNRLETSLFSRMLGSGGREVTDLALGERWLHVAVDPIRDGGNVIKGALGLVSDITDRKRMEMQLLHQAKALYEADRRKDEFLAMLAHELRNPLAPLSNALEIIRIQGTEGTLIAEALEIARRQIQHMARLLEDLLDVSRITRGKVELRKRPVEFNTIVTHAVETIRPVFETLRHELSVRLAPQPLRLEADPTRLEQVVSNLLNNAAKYSEPGGRIAVSLGVEDDKAVLRVRDTGIGIAPEIQPRIFDLFVQADHSLDRAQGGLGIGLTLVRSLVELHGGEISVYSAGRGQGSEFVVRLPALIKGPSGTTGTTPASASAASDPRRILIVDDSLDSTRTLAKLLELRGHKVRCAFDGPSAIEMAAAEEPDFVLLDIGLPGMDGYQVAERLRQQSPAGPLKLIAVTGYGGDEDRRRSQSAGFDYHLVKPVSPDELCEILAGHPAPRKRTG
jgi:PAS domain S-box-containing protein